MSWGRPLALVFLLALAPHCNAGATCGPGTHEASGQCVADATEAGAPDGPAEAAASDSGSLADVTADTADGTPAGDARSEVGADGGTEAAVDAATDGWTCAAQCDCPSGTTCTIDGTCQGSACTAPCQSPSDCPCGRACNAGYCDFPVGSLQACMHDCECGHGEVCGGGKCIVACGHVLDCQSDSDCAACGEVCEPFSSRCTVLGQGCWCTGSCSAWGLAGEICDPGTMNCVLPPGTELDMPGGDFGPVSPMGSRTFSSSATTSATGTTTHVTLVLDLGVSMDDQVQATLIAPDGSTIPASISWTCAGAGPTRWTGTVDLSATPVQRTGTWQLQLTDWPMNGSTPASVSGAWVFLG